MADLVITDKMVETATIWGKADKAAATSASRTIVPTLSLWTEWANQDGTRTTDKSGRITRTWTIETQRTIADKSGRSVSTVDKMLKAGNRLILDFSDVWVISDKGDYLLVPDKSDNLDNPDKWVKWVQGGANALIAHLSGITGRKANNAPNPANDTPPPNSDKSDESAQTGTKQEKTPEPDKKDESPKADEPVNSDKADNPAKADKHDKTAFEAVSAAIGTIRDNMGQITQDERNWAFSAIQDILEKNGMTVITSRSHI